MNQMEMFKYLGAPLSNSRWSWGAVRSEDGAVFLRVWQDRQARKDGRLYFMVTHHEKYTSKEDNLGYHERLLHVDLIRTGAPCYMIMCLAEDVEAAPRKIKDFNRGEVFIGGKVMELHSDTWIEMVGRKPISVVSTKRTT